MHLKQLREALVQAQESKEQQQLAKELNKFKE
jgi:hypothetical protein